MSLYVPSNLCSLEQFVHLLVRHLLPELSEHISELPGTDEPVSLLVEHLEPPNELLYAEPSATDPFNDPGKTPPGVPAGLNPSGRLRIVTNVL